MHFKKRTHVVLLALVTCISLSRGIAQKASPATGGQSGATTRVGNAPARLRAIIASARLEDLRWPNISDQRAHLEAFYRPSGYKLVWLRDGTPTAQAAELIQILQNADEEGLRAEDYDGSRWPQRLTMLQAAHTETDEANFDAALTVCIMRYLSDLHIGRINPRHLDFDFDVAHKKLDLPQFVRQGLVNGSDLHAELATVGPPFAGYQRLRIAFQHYVELAKRDDGAELPYPGVVSAGNKYVGLERLTSLLRLLGDLPESASIPPDSKVYEGALVDAVKHFQERYGLPATGELNYPTIREMNVPLSERLEQMRLGLERYRWIPYKFSQPPIAVNVPEFRLYGFNEKNQLGLSMKVNVGEAYEFQTPIFEKDIQYIVFRPYWNPPPKILRNEIIPELQGHPDLQEANLEIVTGGGQVIKTGRVSDALVQQVRSGKASVRQPPGPENSLGLVKFIFPNEHHVYLHDTPESVDMFSGKERALSHGCIHVQDPAKLAEWLLRNTPGWDLSRVEQAMHDGRNDLRVNLAAPIPLLIVYDTAVVEENGDVHFFHDIYGHDATLKEALAEGYPYPR